MFALVLLALLPLDVSAGAPSPKTRALDPRVLAEVKACLAESARGQGRECQASLGGRVERGELDRAAFYSALSQAENCATFSGAYPFYGASLAAHWVPEAKAVLLRCMEAGNGSAWTYAGTLIDDVQYNSDSARLTAAEWARVHAWCAARQRIECLRFLGVAAFDAPFGGRERARAYAVKYDGEDYLTAWFSGEAACRIGAADDPLDGARTVSWNLGHAMRCVRAPADRAALITLLVRGANADQSEQIVGQTLSVLEQRPDLAAEPAVRAALRECALHSGVRFPCHNYAEPSK